MPRSVSNAVGTNTLAVTRRMPAICDLVPTWMSSTRTAMAAAPVRTMSRTSRRPLNGTWGRAMKLKTVTPAFTNVKLSNPSGMRRAPCAGTPGARMPKRSRSVCNDWGLAARRRRRRARAAPRSSGFAAWRAPRMSSSSPMSMSSSAPRMS
jgi:hypothetical protein